MIAWWWLLPVAVVSMTAGFFVAAALAVSRWDGEDDGPEAVGPPREW